ncbi:NAD-dependent DNA ligase LigA [Nocardioides pakistanensis]
MSNPTAFASRTDFDRRVSDLTAAAASYYDSDVLLMSDAEYDAGIEQVTDALAANPDWATAESEALVSSVAAGQSAGGDVAHPTRMLSMAKADSLDAVDALVAKCSGGVVVEPKMDGLALRVVYRDGRLVQAVTRGDGSTGEDVTAQVLRLSPEIDGKRYAVGGLPLEVPLGYSFEVRGEIYMNEVQFAEANRLRAERGGKPFVNPRNATAGALRKTGDEHWMPLSFAAYDLIPAVAEREDYPSTHAARMVMAFEELDVMTAQRILYMATGEEPSVVTDPDAVRATIAAIESVRPHLGFDIDGAVVKADDNQTRLALGEGSRTPRWAVAFKYAAEEASSVIEDIEVAVGRTGRMSLRARIAPTFVGGTTITYATLHHPGFVAEQGLGIGSKVVVKRAGDVIPRVTAALDEAENAHIETWTPPTACIQCGEEWDTSSLLWRCHTPECSVAGRLAWYGDRDCMDIDGLGGTLAEALAETVLVGGRQVKDIADLYDLTEAEWAGIILGTTSTGGTRTLGTANARKIIASLAATKTQPFNRVITALGIRMTGRSVGRWLAAEFHTMDRLRAATVEEIAAIEKLGTIKATHIVEGLAALGPVIDRLAAHGVNMGSEPIDDGTAKPLAGKVVVISGSVPGYTRTTAQEAVEAAGGKASGSVSAKTSYLVTAETDTSKAKKAASLGVPVIDPDDFAALLRGEVS